MKSETLSKTDPIRKVKKTNPNLVSDVYNLYFFMDPYCIRSGVLLVDSSLIASSGSRFSENDECENVRNFLPASILLILRSTTLTQGKI